MKEDVLECDDEQTDSGRFSGAEIVRSRWQNATGLSGSIIIGSGLSALCHQADLVWNLLCTTRPQAVLSCDFVGLVAGRPAAGDTGPLCLLRFLFTVRQLSWINSVRTLLPRNSLKFLTSIFRSYTSSLA